MILKTFTGFCHILIFNFVLINQDTRKNPEFATRTFFFLFFFLVKLLRINE